MTSGGGQSDPRAANYPQAREGSQADRIVSNAMIRLAHADDANAVRALVADAYGHYIARIGKPPGPMLDDYDRRIAAHQAWVCEERGDVVGLIVLEEGPDGMLLDNVAVSPAAQGRGLGRALIAFAERETCRRGFDEIRLYTHALMEENIALYGRLGYTITGRVQEKGFDRVYMAKSPRGERVDEPLTAGSESAPDAL